MRYVQKKGPDIVIFTFGAEGCMGIYGDNTFSQPAMDVPVVDTTGAGDVFHGAFDTAYLKGMDVVSAARFATGVSRRSIKTPENAISASYSPSSSDVSSIKCTKMGGRAGIPDTETLEKFLAAGEIDYEKINLRAEHYKRGI